MMRKSEDFVSLISFLYRTCSLAIQSTILSLCCLLSGSLKLIIYHIKISLCKITLPTKNNIIPLNKYIINPFDQEILLKVLFEAGYEPFSSHYLARNNQNCSRVKHYILHSVPDAKLQHLIFGMRMLQVKFYFRLILI